MNDIFNQYFEEKNDPVYCMLSENYILVWKFMQI